MSRFRLVRFACIALFTLLVAAPLVLQAAPQIFLREDFASLGNWDKLTFPDFSKASTFEVKLKQGGTMLAIAPADGSNSGLITKNPIDFNEFPNMRWRWLVENVYEKGNIKEACGDDAPLRLAIVFDDIPEDLSFMETMKCNFLKKTFGGIPPKSTLVYVWGNREHPEDLLVDIDYRTTKLILIQKGDRNTGKWIEQDVNVLDDYVAAFGGLPSKNAKLAIISDCDDTNEKTKAFIDYIEVYRN